MVAFGAGSLFLLVNFAVLARRTGELGDALGLATMLLVFAAVSGLAWLMTRMRRDGSPDDFPVRAEVRWQDGGSFALGTVGLESGAMVFRGDAFDFRLTRDEIPHPRTAGGPIQMTIRGISFPLPDGQGNAVLRLGIEERDRDALQEILDGLVSGPQPVFPPLYRAPLDTTVRGEWRVVALLATLTALTAALQQRTEILALVPIAGVAGWILCAGEIWSEHATQRAAERAFRSLQGEGRKGTA